MCSGPQKQYVTGCGLDGVLLDRGGVAGVSVEETIAVSFVVGFLPRYSELFQCIL